MENFVFKVLSIHFFCFLSIGVLISADVLAGEASDYARKCKIALSFDGQGEPTAKNAMEMGFCLGLMDGLRGANYLLKKSDPKSAFCEPSNFDNVDLASVFVKSMENNPNMRDLRGSLAAQVSLAASFPCLTK